MYLCNDTRDFINDILYNSTSMCKAYVLLVGSVYSVYGLWLVSPPAVAPLLLKQQGVSDTPCLMPLLRHKLGSTSR